MSEAAGQMLLTSLPWSCTLLLRGEPIEVRRGTIRVVPHFEPNIYTDVALATSEDMSRDDFLAWSWMLQVLGLSGAACGRRTHLRGALPPVPAAERCSPGRCSPG